MTRNHRKNWQFKLAMGILMVFVVSSLGCSTATLTPSTPAIIKTPVITPISTSNTNQVTPSSLLGRATFTGKYRDLGYDTNNDGQFEFLQIDIELNVTQAGGFGFTTGLRDSSGQLIAIGSLTTESLLNAPLASARLQLGLQTISIYFLGSNIRSSGVNGPYSVFVTLADEVGDIVATSSFYTQAYNHRLFEKKLP